MERSRENTCLATVFVVYVGLGLHAPAAPVAAEEQVVEHTAKGLPDKDIRVGVYLNVLPDCSSGPLPTILVNPPSSGKLTVKKAKASATNYKQCLALEVPAYVAFYRSRPNFSGSDIMTVEVKYPGGRTELQKIIRDDRVAGRKRHLSIRAELPLICSNVIVVQLARRGLMKRFRSGVSR